MKFRHFWSSVLLAGCGAAFPLGTEGKAAVEEDRPSVGTVADLAWLSGAWSGNALGGICEETWSAPRRGTMVGMFRLVRDDGMVVLEFVTIEDTPDGPLYRFQHFEPDYRSWETAPLVYRLTEVEDGYAVFEGLERQEGKPRVITYELVDTGRIDITVQGWGEDSPGMLLQLSRPKANEEASDAEKAPDE